MARALLPLAGLMLGAGAGCVYDTQGIDPPGLEADGGSGPTADAAADAAADELADAALPDAAAPDARPCPGSYHKDTTTGSSYRVHNNHRDWSAAEADCESDGPGIHLVVIDDVAELSAVDLAADAAEVWVGVNDLANEGRYVRVTGGAATFLPWAAGEPNNQLDEDCVELVGNQLNDKSCEIGLSFVCECEE